jgi:hypothetical protein
MQLFELLSREPALVGVVAFVPFNLHGRLLISTWTQSD